MKQLPVFQQPLKWRMFTEQHYAGVHIVEPIRRRAQPYDCLVLSGLDIVKALQENVFALFGFPRAITADRDVHWTGHVFRDWAAAHNIELQLTTSHNRNRNGLVERHNKVQTGTGRSRVEEFHAEQMQPYLGPWPLPDGSTAPQPAETSQRRPLAQHR